MINVGGTKVASLLPNRLVTTRGKKNPCTLYLTFDDGPHPVYTLPICELLDAFSIKATFFCIGKNLEKYPELALRLLDQGHLIANHSDTHSNFGAQPFINGINEANECQSKIHKLDPGCSKIFRAPKGELSISLMVGLFIRRWNIVHWSYDSLDYKQSSIDEQLEVFKKRQVKGGDIILFHDDNQLAIEILNNLLPKWIASGFKFDTVQDIWT
ncbi:MAG: polysaccharide deacetylase family protein [Gammaproteobacteria bacterium]|nr:polysaccharide deacetylase family protein [Gammaproteobacteria bacterium]